MKLLLGLLLTVMASIFSISPVREFSFTKEKRVEVVMRLKDGTVIEKEYSLAQVLILNPNELTSLAKGKLYTCTFMFKGGECTITASTCAAAEAGFNACACEKGHTQYCQQT